MIPAIVALIVLSAIALLLYKRWRAAARAEYIRHYALPGGLYYKLRQKRPALTLKECQLVGQGLRQFFLAYLQGGCAPVAMPSQVVDDLWHEFILYTKDYQRFCQLAFGQFLHHSPPAVLTSVSRSNANLRRVWWHACKEENINPRNATRLPLLFALDAKLNIPDGFRYSVNCHEKKDSAEAGQNVVIYCGGDFASSSFDGSTDGFEEGFFSDGGLADSASDGCGGGGCGGD